MKRSNNTAYNTTKKIIKTQPTLTINLVAVSRNIMKNKKW